jgi:hypothetical protein
MLPLPNTVANSNGKVLFYRNGCMDIMNFKTNYAMHFSSYFSFKYFSILFFVGVDAKVPEEPSENMKVLWIRCSSDQYMMKKKFNSIHPFIGAYQPSVSNYELINLWQYFQHYIIVQYSTIGNIGYISSRINVSLHIHQRQRYLCLIFCSIVRG